MWNYLVIVFNIINTISGYSLGLQDWWICLPKQFEQTNNFLHILALGLFYKHV